MVTIRLARHGCKKRPFYHIVVADKARARDGRYIEQLGTYDPSRPESEIKLNTERLNYWTGVGAQLSPRVAKVTEEYNSAQASA